MTVESSRLGEVDYTLKSSLKNFPSSAVILAAFLSLMINLLPLLLVSLLQSNRK